MKRFEKSTFPRRSPIGGIRTSDTSAAMIVPNAAPMMMPTAMSTTFPRIANSLNSFSMSDPLSPLYASLMAAFPFLHAAKEPARGLLLLRFLCLRVLDLDRRRGHPVFDGHLGADLEVPRDLRVLAPGDLPLVLPLLHDDDVVLELQDGSRHLVRVRRPGEGERGGEDDGASDQQRLLHRRSPFRLRVRFAGQ